MCINPTDSIWVFSTYVEVIAIRQITSLPDEGILHVCGGDPDLPDDDGNMTTYSPRMWR